MAEGKARSRSSSTRALVRRPRGAALLFVLLLTLVMATLVGAFVSINRQQIALSSDTMARQQAYEACMSGFDFVRSQLELQENWGVTGFREGDVYAGSGLQVVYHGNGSPDPEVNYAEGQINTQGGVQFRFTVAIVNQLNSFSSATSSFGPCPPRAARLRVLGRAQGITRRLDVVLRRKAFTDASLASGWDITVTTPTDGRGWSMGTRDVTNLVRANGTVRAPSAVDGLTRFEDTRGQIKAHGDVLLDGRSLNDPAQAAYKDASESAAGGTFSPNSKQVEIPELNSSDLKLPDAVIDVPGGDYRMSNFTYQFFEPDPDHDGRWIKVEQIHQGLRTPTDGYASPEYQERRTGNLDSSGPSGWVDGEPNLNARPVLWSTTVAGVQKDVVVDCTSGNILVPPGVTLRVNDRSGLSFGSDNGVPPTLAMGYRDGGRNPATFPAGRIATPTGAIHQMDEVGAALSSRGPISFGGPVIGLGSLNSDEGDITFSATAGVAASPSVAVAVRAGGSLRMNPPPAVTRAGLRCDGPVFNSAMLQDNQWSSYGLAIFAAEETRQEIFERLGSQRVRDEDGNSLTLGSAWDLLSAELDKGPNPPGREPYTSMTGPLTLEQYVRLREAMIHDDDQYLTDSERDLSPLMANQCYAYSQWATFHGITLQEFMALGAFVPDMWFRGLMYAQGDVVVNAERNSFYNEGAVVARGSIQISNSSDVSSIYNRLFLEDIVKPFGSRGLKLDAVYFNLQ